MMTAPKLALVSPCYNEEAALPLTYQELYSKFQEWISTGVISPESYILFVDDGSKDKTWGVIEKLHVDSKGQIKGLKLAQNVGHQNALFAGLNSVQESCDCCISMDADLQDDINAIPLMVKEFTAGRDVVYGVRKSRATDTAFKKFTALAFYSLMQRLGTKVIYNHADYRLFSQRALKNFCQFEERFLFLRGLALLTSKNYSIVYYDRNERVAGESKYPLSKMLSFAWNGITSFSTKPLQLIATLGFLVSILSLILGVYAIWRHFTGHTITGWTSIMISIYFLGGVQLISLGVIGQYVGKLYVESKKRPRYFEDVKLG